jgi:MFS family permease
MTAPEAAPPSLSPPAQRRGGYLAFAAAHKRFLGFGFALTLFSSFGQTYFLSTFGEPIRAAFGLSAGAWGARYGLATALSAFTLMTVGRRIDDMDLRRWTSFVLVALVGACLLMAWTPSAVMLVLSLFAMRLVAQGLMGHTATTSMARYFEAQRGRALTISGLGFAVGFALFPRLGVELQKTLDWRVAWLCLAGVAGLVVLPLGRALLRGQGERHRRWLADLDAPDDAAVGMPRATRVHWTRAEVLRDWRFYVLLPGTLACPFLMTGMIFFHEDLALAKGWTMEYLSGSMSALALALYVTSIVMGAAVDRFGARRLTPLTQIPLGLGLLALATFDHPAAAILYLVGAGMTMGSMGPVVGSLWPVLYGTRFLGGIRALAGSSMVLATAGAPWFFGLLLDTGVGMTSIAAGSAAYTVIATASLFLALACRPAVKPNAGSA